MKFNDYFQKKDKRYINIPLVTDVELYVDPASIQVINSPYFNSVVADNKIKNFFQHVFSLYLADNKEESIKLILEPCEINATHLGMSSGVSNGNGPSEYILGDVFEKLVELNKVDVSLLSEEVVIPLFVPGFGNDRFSDLLTCIIIKELCDFTTGICEELQIPMSLKEFKYFEIDTLSWEKGEFMLPTGPDEKHIVLLPSGIAKEKYSFNVKSYVWKTIFPARQEYHLSNRTGLTKVKEVKGKHNIVPPTKEELYKEEVQKKHDKNILKKYALEQTLKNPHLLNHYLRFIEE